jgi:hypothetical protein
MYGSHPFYMELRSGGAHGVFFLNSNGTRALYLAMPCWRPHNAGSNTLERG